MSRPAVTSMIRRFVFVLVTAVITASILEAVLRVYEPLPSSVKHGRVVLHVNNRIEVRNTRSAKLPATATFTTNSLGFRGPEPPADRNQYLSIIAIGGSTTEEFFHDDDRTWPALLGQELARDFQNVWVNNAGISGHSTLGHILLVRDHVAPLRPKAVVFLIGVNDVDNIQRFEDVETSYNFLYTTSAPTWIERGYSLLLRSELVGAAITIKRWLRASRYALPYDPAFDLASAPHRTVGESLVRQRLETAQNVLVPAYVRRVERLIRECRSHDIVPIFLTQPALYGVGVDAVTGVNLETIQVGAWNGRTAWLVLDLYNRALEATARRHGVVVVDLAHELPKRSDLYYDLVHFTEKGDHEIARIVASETREALAALAPELRRSRRSVTSTGSATPSAR